jgi:hypothetical protein
MLDNLVRNLLDIALDLSIGELSADKTLGCEESVLWVDDSLALGGNTDETLALLCETDDGWCCSATYYWISKTSCFFVLLDRDYVPSEFSMMRGTLPSMTATAELVVPKSIPMTEPLTFSSPP